MISKAIAAAYLNQAVLIKCVRCITTGVDRLFDPSGLHDLLVQQFADCCSFFHPSQAFISRSCSTPVAIAFAKPFLLQE